MIDGRTGLLVPHGDVEALAAAIGRVLTDADLRKTLGEGAREFAQRFSWDRSADETEAHLATVLETVAVARRQGPATHSLQENSRSITRRS